MKQKPKGKSEWWARKPPEPTPTFKNFIYLKTPRGMFMITSVEAGDMEASKRKAERLMKFITSHPRQREREYVIR